jgi:hypothetical protein
VTHIGVIFNNTDATVEVQAGTLQLTNGGTGTGSVFTLASDATLQFAGLGGYRFDQASSLSGAGTVSIIGGTVTAPGTYDITGATLIDAGALIVDHPVTNFGALTIDANGTLTGTQESITTTDRFTWSSGHIIGTGASNMVFDVDGSIDLNGIRPNGGGHELRHVTLNLNGMTTFTGSSNTISLSGGAVSNNNVKFIASNDGQTIDGANGDGTFKNIGLFENTEDDTHSGITRFNGVTLDNSGLVQVDAGTIELSGAATTNVATGAMNVYAGATLITDGLGSVINDGTLLFTDSITGHGHVNVANGGEAKFGGSVGADLVVSFDGIADANLETVAIDRVVTSQPPSPIFNRTIRSTSRTSTSATSPAMPSTMAS